MRVVEREEDFEKLFEVAQQETIQAFGDDQMYLEKYLPHARHIEIQILADRYGNTVHLGERDCSIQRRHQKLIEETPAGSLPDDMIARMGDAAVRAARSVGYDSVGTVEFLAEDDGQFYFMEMNTRIQVEHPVTEMVTGIDLVKEMIRVSAGERLAFEQKDIVCRGHAIECRICAEDPKRGFLPGTGTVRELYLPGGNGVRVDTMLYQGYTVPPFYDSMLAKVIVCGGDRQEAIHKMRGALGELVIEGIATNLDFQYELVSSQEFASGDVQAINKRIELDLEER